MTSATVRSEALSERARELIPGGVSSSLRGLDPPLVFTRAKGSRVWDADGREYVDFHAGFGPTILGHADDRVRERVMETAREIDIVGAGSTELEIALAEKLREHVPSAERVLFTGSGSEATYHAIRVARAATGRPIVVKFQGGYHGWHDYTGANVISRADLVGSIDPISAGILPQALERLAVLRFNDVEALETLMSERGHEVAAIILEPVMHTIGCVPPDPGFLEALRRTTHEAGAVLIFDEVVTGFRHDLGGYQAMAGVTPDLTTFAKAMANGYPIAALCGRADLMDRFNTRPDGTVMYGGTFNGHPLSIAAALATIEILEADDRAIHRHLFRLGAAIGTGLAAIVERLGIDARPASLGSVFVCYFTGREVRSFDDALASDEARYVAFHRGMTERGFLMLPLNLKRNHLMAAHSDEDVARMLQAAEDVLAGFAARRARPNRPDPTTTHPRRTQ
jgi:glutamate-1-semialdehyde 2,1-aminomutase